MLTRIATLIETPAGREVNAWVRRFAALVPLWNEAGDNHRHLLSLLRGHRMKALLKRLLDETEFLSDYGVRAISRAHHRENPYRFHVNGKE